MSTNPARDGRKCTAVAQCIRTAAIKASNLVGNYEISFRRPAALLSLSSWPLNAFAAALRLLALISVPARRITVV